jgi:hypothetical protein
MDLTFDPLLKGRSFREPIVRMAAHIFHLDHAFVRELAEPAPNILRRVRSLIIGDDTLKVSRRDEALRVVRFEKAG